MTRALSGPDADPTVRTIVVTTFEVDDYALIALRNGAYGFLLKRSGPVLLIEAIRAASAGDMLIIPQLTKRLLHHVAKRSPQGGPDASLTARVEQVASLVAEGLSNSEIAKDLHLAVGTVKNVVAAVGRKIGARNRVGIALEMWERCSDAGRP